MTQDILSKMQALAIELRKRLIEKHGEDVQIYINQLPFDNFEVTMVVNGKSDTYTIYQNTKGEWTFCRHWNGVI